MSNDRDRSPLLIEILAALGDVRISERYLIDEENKKTHFLHGTQSGEEIVINEAVAIVPTLIHELIHFVRPEWEEKTVRRFTTRLVRQLSHSEVKAIYEQYRERKVEKREDG